VLFIAVSLGWLVLVLFTIAMFRLAAISDARREAELSEWLATPVVVKHRAADAGGDAERLPPESQPGIHRAAG
jgi:hypothetical protein